MPISTPIIASVAGVDGAYHARPPALNLATASLFLDLDGTLAPIESRPDEVGPDPRRTGLLKALASRLDGRLAILSGRTVAEIDRILDGAVIPAAGVHGLQRRDATGALVSPPAHPAIADAQARFEAFAARTPGLIVERKPQSVALHYRGAAHLAGAALTLGARFAADTGLTLQRGNGVVELRTPGADKGDALQAFMTERPFADGIPIMVGDDLTDEAGFIASRTLGGFGILVGAPRATAAAYRLDTVEAVLSWLEAALGQTPKSKGAGPWRA